MSPTPLILNERTKSIRLSPNGFSILEEFKSVRPSAIPVQVLVDFLPPLLIPKDFFEEYKKFDYIRMQYPTNDLIELMIDPIEQYVSLFIIPMQFHYQLRSADCLFSYQHQSTYLYQKLSSNDKIETDNFLQLFVGDSFIDITLRKDNQLCLINRFNYAIEEDILYYLSNILKQFELSGANIPIYLYDSQGVYAERVKPIIAPYFTDIYCNTLSKCE